MIDRFRLLPLPDRKLLQELTLALGALLALENSSSRMIENVEPIFVANTGQDLFEWFSVKKVRSLLPLQYYSPNKNVRAFGRVLAS